VSPRETTVVFNGDILTDVDIAEVVAGHMRNKAEATIVLAPVDDPSTFGLVETGPDGRVLRFLEKPSAEILAETKLNTINAGIYILEPSVLGLIPANENCSFEYDVFPKIVETRRQFFSHILRGEYWRDLGNPASYLAAHHDLLGDKVRGFNIPPASANEVATTAEVDRVSVLGEGCVVKPNAKIQNSVLGPGVHVDEKASITNSVIWAHTRISAAAEIDGAVIGRSCYIGRNTSIRSGAVLGDKTSLPDYSKI
jgi:NDP-sugar pyrophosphorylase family protein